ncbi:hypothetical protein CDD83_8489 [Cordyceps sp. RAO-2017]|nr:hypothetical protein CDD83_8489 [Cordyceps sp. RAO-2017]
MPPCIGKTCPSQTQMSTCPHLRRVVGRRPVADTRSLRRAHGRRLAVRGARLDPPTGHGGREIEIGKPTYGSFVRGPEGQSRRGRTPAPPWREAVALAMSACPCRARTHARPNHPLTKKNHSVCRPSVSWADRRRAPARRVDTSGTASDEVRHGSIFDGEAAAQNATNRLLRGIRHQVYVRAYMRIKDGSVRASLPQSRPRCPRRGVRPASGKGVAAASGKTVCRQAELGAAVGYGAVACRPAGPPCFAVVARVWMQAPPPPPPRSRASIRLRRRDDDDDWAPEPIPPHVQAASTRAASGAPSCSVGCVRRRIPACRNQLCLPLLACRPSCCLPPAGGQSSSVRLPSHRRAAIVPRGGQSYAPPIRRPRAGFPASVSPAVQTSAPVLSVSSSPPPFTSFRNATRWLEVAMTQRRIETRRR